MSDARPDQIARARLIERYAVSRETLRQLDLYAELLGQWQGRMNLVAASTLEQKWERHFLDSAQLLDLVPSGPLEWVDMGSGAGFPAMVIAILRPDVMMTVIESRQKKVGFLSAIASACGIESRVNVVSERIENLPPRRYDMISARALASMSQLFDWGLRFADSDTRWALPKGESVEAEISDARQSFRFDVELRQSLTDPRGRIALVRAVERRKSR